MMVRKYLARKYLLAGFASLCSTSGAWAQFGAPAIPGPPAAVAAAPAAQPSTLWSFLGISCKDLEECRRKKCKTPCGQMMGTMFAPMSALTGGIIQPFCPLTPSLEELADPGAVGAAAKVKADEAGAKARRAAVRYLGTVDCHYWPEAEAALIEALRGDKNECVRYEAALALGNGCCCTKKTMEALRIASSCSDVDGAPKETSDRVRAAAIMALEHCLACYVDNTPPPEKVREGKAPEGGPPPAESAPPPKPQPDGAKTQPSDDVKTQMNTALKIERPVGKAYYAKINEVPRNMIVEEARKVVAKYNQTNSARNTLRGQNSLVQIVERVSTNPNDDINGTRAEVVSARPQNVWDMLVRQTPQANTSFVTVTTTTAPPPVATSDVVVTIPQPMPAPAMVKIEPAPAVVKVEPAPMISRAEPIPAIENTTVSVLPMPEPIKPLSPSDIVASPYAVHTAVKPKARVDVPAKLPPVMATEVANTERQSMKLPAAPVAPVAPVAPAPVAEPKLEAKLSTPVVAKAPTAVAQHALKVFNESNSASVREQAADSLTASDVASCSELQPALISIATGTDGESTRKCAIKALVRTDCTNVEVMQTLERLTEDSSAGIRVEAAIGMARLRLKASKN